MIKFARSFSWTQAKIFPALEVDVDRVLTGIFLIEVVSFELLELLYLHIPLDLARRLSELEHVNGLLQREPKLFSNSLEVPEGEALGDHSVIAIKNQTIMQRKK